MQTDAQSQPVHAETSNSTSRFIITFSQIKKFFRVFWRGLREWCGDSAYERYLHAPAAKKCDSRTLTREEFYVEQLNRRYSRPNRCC